jgi:hypothetical protein
MKILCLISLYLLIAVRAFAFEYEVAMCCIFQNEERFLKEWIDYHLLIGVQHFYMYDNDSIDNPRNVLDPYIEAGIVDYIPWNRGYNTSGEWWRVQVDAYIDAVERARNVTKWLCIIDTDEFIVPIKDINIHKFLKDFESYGGVCLNWLCFGTSNIKRIPKGRWMTEMLLRRSFITYINNRIVKSIVQPEHVDSHRSFFPHICAYHDGYYQVNANKVPFEGESTDVCVDRIRIHHYWCRDLDFMYQVKIPRYIRWYGEQKREYTLEQESQMNKKFDDSILKVIKKNKSSKKKKN